MKKYRIGEMSSLVGLAPHVIRFYETQGIINSSQRSENNYRYYDYHDSCRLMYAKLYRSLGFSLSESAELIGKCSREQLLERFDRRSDEIDNEILRLQHQKNRLRVIQDNCRIMEDCMTEYRIIQRPGFYWVGGGDKEEIFIGSDIEEIYRCWMEKLPSVYFFGVIPMEALLKETELRYSYGIALNEENIKYPEPDNRLQIKYFPSCSALYGVIEKNETGPFRIEHFKKLLNYISINNLIIEGPALIELIGIIYEGGMKCNRFGISVPIHNIA
ncbi:mercuric resistance operon regulatory protein [Oxobacter pfennigii]|uniref:Mercuric resistance operon regulatory protein n=1 Tax=Oxobacter pfennigii TaxID=36849 RepID=A0A0P8W6I4_9CLOT|nr:MerR family transcriptional regulator [Oxobacter pfennigii]KPU44308.1 mercuric resistance operon regulatory protein [Oxobacter pfennigii]